VIIIYVKMRIADGLFQHIYINRSYRVFWVADSSITEPNGYV